MQYTTYDIAIVGDGAASVAFLNSLVKNQGQNISQKNIIIFARDNSYLGTGKAYQPDMETLLLNRPVQSMSVDIQNPQDCLDWLKDKPNFYNKCVDCASAGSYLPRYIFGYYLNDRFYELVQQACQLGITVNVIRHSVVDVDNGQPHILTAADGKQYKASYVIYCCGHLGLHDFYQLQNTPAYIHNPYPISQTVNKVLNKQKVAIIGNSLTAIDVALSLNDGGYQGKVALLSRRNIYPYVRGVINRKPLNYLNHDNLQKLCQKHGKLSLRDLLRLFRREMKSVNQDWRFVFKAEHQGNLKQHLKQELNVAETPRAWQSVLASTNNVIEKAWYNLSYDAKLQFLRYYHRAWLNTRSPIPAYNANKLLSMLDKGQLDYKAYLQDIDYNPMTKDYSVQSGCQIEQFDVIINASGMRNHLKPEDGLLYHLVEKQQLIIHSLGGVAVDFDSSAVIRPDDTIDYTQYVIGQATSGVYYYTTSLEMIAKHADSIARQLVEKMSQEAKTFIA